MCICILFCEGFLFVSLVPASKCYIYTLFCNFQPIVLKFNCDSYVHKQKNLFCSVNKVQSACWAVVKCWHGNFEWERQRQKDREFKDNSDSYPELLSQSPYFFLYAGAWCVRNSNLKFVLRSSKRKWSLIYERHALKCFYIHKVAIN